MSRDYVRSVVEQYQIGDRWAEEPPAQRPNDHELGPNRVLVGSQVCGAEHGHHRTHQDRKCGTVTYTPPMTAECSDSGFDGRSR